MCDHMQLGVIIVTLSYHSISYGEAKNLSQQPRTTQMLLFWFGFSVQKDFKIQKKIFKSGKMKNVLFLICGEEIRQQIPQLEKKT